MNELIRGLLEEKQRLAAENRHLRAALERVTRQCDTWITECCGAEVGVRFCENWGCENIVELRALATLDPVTPHP